MNNLKLYIRSSDRQSGTTNKGVIKIKEANSISGEYYIMEFTTPDSFYNVTNYNNKLYINDNGNLLNITLTSGNYTEAEFTSYIQTTINSNAVSGTFTVSYNDITNKYTITSTQNFILLFGTYTSNSCRKLLGFSQTDTSNSTSHTSDIPVDLSSLKYIHVNLNKASGNNFISSNVYFTSSFVIRDKLSQFGGIFNFRQDDMNLQTITLSSNIIDYEIFNDNNEYIENLGEWIMILQRIIN